MPNSRRKSHLLLLAAPCLLVACSSGGSGGTGGGAGASSASSSSSGAGGTGGASSTASSSSASSSSSTSTGAGGMAPACTNVFQGSFTIQNQIDITTISPYCEITGNLLMNGAGLATVSLPALQKIDGALSIHSELTTLSLPSLTYAGDISTEAQNLAMLSLPALTSTHFVKVVYSAVSMPALHDATSLLFALVPSVDLGALVSVGQDLSICDGTATLNVPNLASIGHVLGLGNTSLTTLAMPALTSVGLGLPPMTASIDLNLPLCSSSGSPLLNQLALPLLVNLGSGNTGIFRVGFNPAIPQCRIDALATQLTLHGWTGTVTSVNMGPASPCP